MNNFGNLFKNTKNYGQANFVNEYKQNTHFDEQNLKFHNYNSMDIQKQSVNQVPQKASTELANEQKFQENDRLKWESLSRFHSISLKAHEIYFLKPQTTFLAYTLAQKSVHFIEQQRISFQYWVACCLFISMKYEEIYPPRLKDIGMLVKMYIKHEQYYEIELMILEEINYDLGLPNLNIYLSQYVHAVNEDERFFIFYLLDIALVQRKYLKKFTLKQLVLSCIYILSSKHLYLPSNSLIQGIPIQHLQECSKIIMISQTYAETKLANVFKKYSSTKTRQVSSRPLPYIASLSSLFHSKSRENLSISRVMPATRSRVRTEMVDEAQEKQPTKIVVPIFTQRLLRGTNKQMIGRNTRVL